MQDKCVKQNKFVEAELCKQRIDFFKKKEKEKFYENLVQRHKEEVSYIIIIIIYTILNCTMLIMLLN